MKFLVGWPVPVEAHWRDCPAPLLGWAIYYQELLARLL